MSNISEQPGAAKEKEHELTIHEINETYKMSLRKVDSTTQTFVNQFGEKPEWKTWVTELKQFLHNEVKNNGSTAEGKMHDFSQKLKNKLDSAKNDEERQAARAKSQIFSAMWNLLFSAKETAAAPDKQPGTIVKLSGKEQAAMNVISRICTWVRDKIRKVVNWLIPQRDEAKIPTEYPSASGQTNNVVPINTGRPAAAPPDEKLAA